MYRIKLLTIGKIKDRWLTDAIDDYLYRLQGRLSLTTQLARSDDHLATLASKEEYAIGLDPCGTSYTSEEFSRFLLDQLESGGARLTVVIGGPDGLPSKLKKSLTLVSLSPLTFTHQMARLLLVEQCYRALEIARGSAYHK